MLGIVENVSPDLIVHAAAQPSHDLAAAGHSTTSMSMQSARSTCSKRRAGTRPRRVFVFMSTNKVYGDRPNDIASARTRDALGVRRPGFRRRHRGRLSASTSSKHSLFGASKVAADVMVQEYGRYFGMQTCCLRGGCLTGPNHSGVELHGFLSYLIKCNVAKAHLQDLRL